MPSIRRLLTRCLLLGLVGLTGCGSGASATTSPAGGSGPAGTAGAGSTAAAGSAASAGSAGPSAGAGHRRHRRHHRHRPAAPSPGRLPQTDVLPHSDTRTFHAEMADLWRGVQLDSTRRALPAFFPVDAYAQLKTLGDPRGDWSERLVGDYRLDLGAAHRLLGADARRDRLVEVLVPEQYAHWVPPGVCDNSIGYYEVPNARVVYRTPSSALASFGIASMISWRGVWYVVHLGEVLRPVVTGVVDDPSSGTGVSAPSSTC